MKQANETLSREVDKRRTELAEKQGWKFLTYSGETLQGVHPNHGDRPVFECASCPVPSLDILLETEDHNVCKACGTILTEEDLAYEGGRSGICKSCN